MKNKTNTILLSLILAVVVLIAIWLFLNNAPKKQGQVSFKYTNPSETIPANEEISYSELSSKYLTIIQSVNDKGEHGKFEYKCNSNKMEADIIEIFSITKEIPEPIKLGESGLFSRRAYVCGNQYFIEQWTGDNPQFYGPYNK